MLLHSGTLTSSTISWSPASLSFRSLQLSRGQIWNAIRGLNSWCLQGFTILRNTVRTSSPSAYAAVNFASQTDWRGGSSAPESSFCRRSTLSRSSNQDAYSAALLNYFWRSHSDVSWRSAAATSLSSQRKSGSPRECARLNSKKRRKMIKKINSQMDSIQAAVASHQMRSLTTVERTSLEKSKSSHRSLNVWITRMITELRS